MPKYVKRSIAVASVAASFLLGCPITEVALWLISKAWSLYGAYVRLWLEQYAVFFLALCGICGAVAAIYGVVLVPLLFSSKSSQGYVDGELLATCITHTSTDSTIFTRGFIYFQKL